MRLFSLVSVYDDCNNITEIYKNNALIRKYTYDDLQQITRENIIESEATTGKQYDFEYDLYGNKLSKTESTYTGCNRGDNRLGYCTIFVYRQHVERLVDFVRKYEFYLRRSYDRCFP